MIQIDREFCPVRDVLDRIGDKWSMLVLLTLYNKGTLRFKEIHREIPDLSEKVLTSTLRVLESDGYLNREVYAQVPPKVEYKLTEMGVTLLPHIKSLIDWALRNSDTILTSRKEVV